ncbi:MAG: hypothetical protein IJ455_00210 [Agathobacter sp.]|nr:hypothetical protein [Agathobacter sp.]
MIITIEIIPGRYAKNKTDIKRDVNELGLGLEKQSYLLNKYPIDAEDRSDGLGLLQNRNAKCVEELFFENKYRKNLYVINTDSFGDIDYDIARMLYIWSGEYIIGFELIEAAWNPWDALIEYRYSPCRIYKATSENTLYIALMTGELQNVDGGLTEKEIEIILQQSELIKEF